ncbi:sorting nexin 2B isoform X2 [Elaeis guineensis]|uniref:Sorting nexin 2B isoform X1 n=1 Tax=Elaeis guineensis var. tenera TaxID=51953 RepID=A0A6I9RRP4_ELAGV|nr:sorting nexin 2B isoform X1 [Elaeis guineensis]XP_019708638.1 sorting nexin 2B isoform X1 [Elaeis guineensis]
MMGAQYRLEPPSAREEVEALVLAPNDPHPLAAAPATPAAIHGGDALLFPTLCPHSLSSFLDPPAYANVVFSSFDSQNGASGSHHFPGRACSSCLAADGAAVVSDYFRITVSDPQKEEETAGSLVPGSGTCVTYLITTKIDLPDSSGGGATEFRVRRRFRDVVTLADRLAKAYRGFFIPPRPDKNVVESQVMHKHEFVEQRRSALEKYLRRLAVHPVIGKSDELRVFLRTPGKLPLPASTDVASRMLDGVVMFGAGGTGYATPQDALQPAKRGRNLLRIFKELKQSVANDWGGVKPAMVQEDNEFLERKEKVQDLEQRLSIASQQAEALVKAQQDIGETMGALGLAFIKLAKFETKATYDSQRIRAADIKHLATTAVKASRFYCESNAQTVKHLGTLHEYLGLMLAVHSAFSDRSHALLTIQTLLSDLSSLHAKAKKLEAASSKIFGGDKSKIRQLEELKETIRITEDAKSCALKEYEQIKENNRTELERLNRERHDDFVAMLKGFIINQVANAEKIADIWAREAEETRRHVKGRDRIRRMKN